MPHDEGLPQTGDSQEIGQDAYDCLRAKRPKGWQLTELGGVNDFGFDLQVQISLKQQVVHPFRIQLKGTRSPRRSADGSFLSIDLSTTTLRYFDNTDEPVLLVLCDLSVDPDDPRECTLHYVWIREELDRIQIASISLTQKEVAIRVPTANVLDRTTDLVDEVRKRHRLSRVGHALDTSVAGLDPSLGSEDRVVMVEAITRNIGARSIVFAQALAEPTTEIWINPPRGTLAWLLTEAKSAVASGNVDQCADLLRRASERSEPASALENAEYWHLTGRLSLVRGDDDGASRAFKTAAETQPQAKYWAAWAESEMRSRFRTDQGQDYSDVLEALPADADPALLGVKARLLAASRNRTKAIALLDTFEGAESLAARAVIETMFSNPEQALKACIDGIALEEKRESTRLLFLILRARARFNIALKSARVEESSGGDSEDDMLPPSGPIGVDAAALRGAWADIEEAASALEEIRWVSNAEFVIDIWIATASMLGKQEQILARVLAAARQRPQQAELQAAAETLAAQCGDFQSALEANSRLPDGNIKILRRVSFLHELGKHRDSVELMTENIGIVSRSHQLFGPVLVLAALSAEVMARDSLVEAWRDILRSGNAEEQAHAATLDYLIARRRNQLQSSEALTDLARVDEQLGHPKPTTLLLFNELDPGSNAQAEQFLAVATRVRSTIRLAPMIAVKIGVALITQKRWSELLALCEEANREFDVTGRIRAFQALALDQLGRSDEARIILESILEGGIEDGLALNTYVNIMVRWGFTEKAKAAAELILERAQSKERRVECVRMLFNLEQHANPTSPRLVDLAFRMGALASSDDEVEEAVFLCMVIAATSFETAALSDARKEEFQARANAFFERFPESKIVRRVELPAEAGAEEMLRSMKSAIGISEEREEQRARLEAQLQSGELPLPFAWRPRFALGNVQDVAHLWELAKRSTADEKKFHLNMICGQWEQRHAESFRSRTPLFDLLTLFVLEDLELLDKAFDFFPKVAISQATLGELMKMSQAFSGSIFWQRCIDVQDRLKPRLAQILQPHGAPSGEEEEVHLPTSSRELHSIVRTGDYIVYSDDAMLRMWVLGNKPAADGMCTLDLLCALEEIDLLTTEEVATKLAQLCDWNVGIQIQLRHQLALIPEMVRVAPRILEAAALLRGVLPFMSLARGMWGARTDFMSVVNHVGAVVRLLVQDPDVPNVVIGAFLSVWIDHATARSDVPLPALQLAAHVVVYAVAAEKLPIEAARRLWNVYFGVVEAVSGAPNPKTYDLALARVAQQSGVLDKRMFKERVTPKSTIGERLMMGLDVNSIAWVGFCAAYLRGRR
jgi:tetratricopeptide (TPR) repeat protein